MDAETLLKMSTIELTTILLPLVVGDLLLM